MTNQGQNERVCENCAYKKNKKSIFGNSRNWCCISEQYLEDNHSCPQFVLAIDVSMGKMIYLNLLEAQGGLSKAQDEVYKLLTKASEGDVAAYVKLGYSYMKGIYEPRDEHVAFYYFKLAADLGDCEAQYNTALCYSKGDGVEKNQRKLLQYMTKSADSGFWLAAYWLAEYYRERNNPYTAKCYYKIAAKQGHAGAQYYLAESYIHEWSHGKAKSLSEGLFWYECAYLHGENDKKYSNKALERINYFLRDGYPKKMIDVDLKKIQQSYKSYLSNPK